MNIDEIRALAAFHRIRKKELAAVLRMNFAGLSHVLNGRRQPPADFETRVEGAIAKILEHRTMQTAAARDLLPGRPA